MAAVLSVAVVVAILKSAVVSDSSGIGEDAAENVNKVQNTSFQRARSMESVRRQKIISSTARPPITAAGT